MNLKRFPADFSSAYNDNHFSFEGADPTVATELVFRTKEGAEIGVRRYVGRESIDSSPRALLMSGLTPEPLGVVEECGFLRPEGRDMTLSVGYDGGLSTSPEVCFVASLCDQQPDAIMGEPTQRRSIAPGECDEVAFCLTEGAEIEATLVVDEIAQNSLGSYSASEKGVVVFAVSADAILSELRSAESATAFEIRFAIDGRECASVHYSLREPHSEDVRLAWLAPDGAIAYHTFPSPQSVKLQTERTLYRSPSGSVTAGVEHWQESVLDSGVLSSADAQRLGEMLSSAHLWRITEEGAEPQIILSHQAEVGGRGVRRVTLTLRPAATTKHY